MNTPLAREHLTVTNKHCLLIILFVCPSNGANYLHVGTSILTDYMTRLPINIFIYWLLHTCAHLFGFLSRMYTTFNFLEQPRKVSLPLLTALLPQGLCKLISNANKNNWIPNINASESNTSYYTVCHCLRVLFQCNWNRRTSEWVILSYDHERLILTFIFN